MKATNLPPRRRAFIKASVLLASACVGLVIGELALRAVLPKADEYYVRPPHTRLVFRPRAAIMPGVDGDARYLTNARGIRGDELAPDFQYRIFAVGGSTTECLYLDQYEAWPRLLQQRLDAGTSARKVWVGNVGKSGLGSRDHVVLLKYLLRQYDDVDAVVVLVGVNDLTSRLRQDDAYDPDFISRADAERVLLRRNFSVAPDPSLPFYKRAALWRLLREVKQAAFPPRYARGEVQDRNGEVYVTWRERRRDARVIRGALPDLAPALGEYARNLNAIIDLARSKRVRLILLTQPTLWRPEMPADLDGLLWMGGVGDFQKEAGKEYYSAGALAEGMALYNEALLKVCRERGVECVDLASLIPKDATAFYDDCHLNESGARLVADALARYLTEHPS